MNSAERSDVNDNEILLFIGNVESNLGMRNFFTVFVKNDENSETCSVGKFENIAEIYFAYGIFIFVNKVQSVGTHEKIGRRRVRIIENFGFSGIDVSDMSKNRGKKSRNKKNNDTDNGNDSILF